ncbi:DUF6934 family protein [Chitinophaga alhagiae]|uniref:DUF6934 family protein n=1 Tax=Chitinophaga alhagiae TaxID=2203219 RepID=UPI000E5A35EB|nr:hypothetical protein [Chitinophaga alhagiae]
MHLEKYDFVSNPAYTSFAFQSAGAHGTIEKVINYQPIPGFILSDGRQVINLGFGDWDEGHRKVDDSTVSNNGDRSKVLSTVASTIFAYMEKHGKLPVFAKGNCPSRTRLYQMSLNAHLAEEEEFFNVFGLLQDGWHPFRPGVNYQAFLVTKK